MPSNTLAQVKDALTRIGNPLEGMGYGRWDHETARTYYWVRSDQTSDIARAALPALDALVEELARLRGENERLSARIGEALHEAELQTGWKNTAYAALADAKAEVERLTSDLSAANGDWAKAVNHGASVERRGEKAEKAQRAAEQCADRLAAGLREISALVASIQKTKSRTGLTLGNDIAGILARAALAGDSPSLTLPAGDAPHPLVAAIPAIQAHAPLVGMHFVPDPGKIGNLKPAAKPNRYWFDTAVAQIVDEALAATPPPPDHRPPVMEPPMSHPWCQPGDMPDRRFLVTFDDRDRSTAVFEEETEARNFWKRADTNWNCYLFGALPRVPDPRPPVDAHGPGLHLVIPDGTLDEYAATGSLIEGLPTLPLNLGGDAGFAIERLVRQYRELRDWYEASERERQVAKASDPRPDAGMVAALREPTMETIGAVAKGLRPQAWADDHHHAGAKAQMQIDARMYAREVLEIVRAALHGAVGGAGEPAT